MKELKQITNDICKIFEIKDISCMVDRLYEIVFSDEKDKLYDKYMDIVENFKNDYIMNIYSEFLAERENLKQDYTPEGLANFVSQICLYGFDYNCNYFDNIKTCYDACAGSGSLTLAVWKKKPDIKFYLEELDKNVISFLLFNLSIRNIEAEVIHGNILSGERYTLYRIRKQEKYSNVEKIDLVDNKYEFEKVDISISNPPFNLSYKEKDKEKYIKWDGYVQQGKADGLFMLKCLDQTKETGRVVIIESHGMLFNSDKSMKSARKYIVNHNILHSIIGMPEKMFYNTEIPTIVMYLDKNKQDEYFRFIDNSKINISSVTRYRNGTGDACHANRTYEKKFNSLDDGNIYNIIEAVEWGESPYMWANESSFRGKYVVKVKLDDILENDYNLNISRYTI